MLRAQLVYPYDFIFQVKERLSRGNSATTHTPTECRASPYLPIAPPYTYFPSTQECEIPSRISDNGILVNKNNDSCRILQ